MSRNRSSILAAAALVVLSSLLYFGGDLLGLRVIFGIPFLLLLPGHMAMLFVDPDSRSGGFEWLALAVALSTSVTAMVGVTLGMTVGVSQHGVVASVAAVSGAMLLAAALRGSGVAGRTQPMRRTPVRRGIWAAVALLACTAITLWLSVPREDASHTANVVQLWAIRDAEQGGMNVGVKNVDAAATDYRLTISQSGRRIAYKVLDLPAGATRVVHVTPSELASGTALVTATVRDASASATVSPRKVSIWMPE